MCNVCNIKRLCLSEYRAFKDRLQKAVGTKREKIAARLRTMPAKPRIVLGGILVIDRHSKRPESRLEGDVGNVGNVGEGKHWHVRTLARGIGVW